MTSEIIKLIPPTAESLKSLGITLLLATLGAVALSAVYKRIQTEWPAAYTSVKASIDNQVRESPLRSYIFLRGGPIAILTAFTITVIQRAGGYPWIGITTLLAIHIYSTNFKAMKEVFRKPQNPNWTILTIYHTCSIAVIFTFGITVTTFRNKISPLIPDNNNLLTAAWSAVFVTILAAIAQSLLTPQHLQGQELINSLIHDIGRENWCYIEQVARQKHINHAELLCLKSIILAEAQQRPSWFRRLEKVKGYVIKKGTYGVAQFSSDKPISDKTSIKKLADFILDDGALKSLSAEQKDRYNPDLIRAIEKLADKHNPDSQHKERIIHFFNTLQNIENNY